MFYSLLTKTYAGEMSCNQLPLSDSATYVCICSARSTYSPLLFRVMETAGLNQSDAYM